ncbi:MAG: hypothetical protein L6R39_006950 [Caloplaca ligustica]|nr:MAG: hypothetical protein L6R39_006950 [Caloplaca ligustica]
MKPLSARCLQLGQRRIGLYQRNQSTACQFTIQRHPVSPFHLQKEMTSRELPVLTDYGSPTPQLLLASTLVDAFKGLGRYVCHAKRLIPGYHLVYLPSPTNVSSLGADDTDSLHSPGTPFTRRMWAGGDITFVGTIHHLLGKMICRESITNVQVEGKEGEEKVFVTIQRNITVRGRGGYIVENRRLVFMRNRPPADPTPEIPVPEKGSLKPSHKADFSFTLTPSPALLFRFSALTFNAHRIHLDQAYCRNVEGHRNLLVHGPLSLVLMLHFLQYHLTRECWERRGHVDIITYVDYRCLAPLYAQEKLKVCVRKKDTHLWETWIEGPDGGLAVRASVKTAPSPLEQSRKDGSASSTTTAATLDGSGIDGMLSGSIRKYTLN